MKMRIVFLFCFACGCVSLAAGQAKTVTNTDLEKYRNERIRAEAYLRENYARLGFPSPEEMDRRNEQSAREMAELSTRLRQERIERERIEAVREAAERPVRSVYDVPPFEIGPEIYGGFYVLSGGRRFRLPFRRSFQQSGYFAGGMFIPTGPATRPKPVWRVVPPRR